MTEASLLRIADALSGCPRCGAQEAPGTPSGGSWWWPQSEGPRCRSCHYIVQASDAPLDPWGTTPPRLHAVFRCNRHPRVALVVESEHVVCMRRLDDIPQETSYQKERGYELVRIEFTPQMPPEWTHEGALPILINDDLPHDEDAYLASWADWAIWLGGTRGPLVWQCCLVENQEPGPDGVLAHDHRYLMRDFLGTPEQVQAWLDKAVTMTRYWHRHR